MRIVRDRGRTRSWKLAWLTLVLATIGVGELNGQSITGQVVSADSGNGIENAFVEVLDANDERITAAFTGRGGGFRLQLPESTDARSLVIGAIGYQNRTWSIPQAREDDVIDLGTLELRVTPVSLLPLEIEVTRSRLTPGREWVRRRQLLGNGRFFSGAVLGVIDPPSLSAYLAEETKMWVSYDASGIPSLSNPAADCTLMFVNEWPMNAAMDSRIPRPRIGVESIDRTPMGTGIENLYLGFPSLDHIPLERIAAIEVYEEMRDVPPGRLSFSAAGAHPCAVVNVWTWDSW